MSSRKGGFEMSMNFFIVLILSIILIVIAYFIYRNGLTGLTDSICASATDVLGEIFDLMNIPSPPTVC